MNRFIIFLIAVILSHGAHAGDEFQLPTISESISYESVKPKYHVIGVENRGKSLTLWVVANSDVVLTQRGVNKIISDIQRRHPKELNHDTNWNIYFYLAVHDTPRFPAFRITEFLAYYSSKENKTKFMSGKLTYGGWAYGPKF